MIVAAANGQRLLALFAVLMMVVGALMLRDRSYKGDPTVRLSRENLPKLLGLGLPVGLLSGFFGIGGGFLIVPDAQRDRIIASVCHHLRADHGGKLCLVRSD